MKLISVLTLLPIFLACSQSGFSPQKRPGVLTAASALAASSEIKTALQETLLDSLNKGVTFFFMMDRNVGSLQTGKAFLFRRDSASRRDSVSSVSDYKSLSTYPSPSDARLLHFHNVFFRVGVPDANGICLIQEGMSGCAAHLKSTLFGIPAGQISGASIARELGFNAYLDRYAETMASSMRSATQYWLSCFSACITGHNFWMYGDDFRNLSTLLPFIANPKYYFPIADALEYSFYTMRSSFADPGANEQIALASSALAHGLVPYFFLTKNPLVASWIIDLTTPQYIRTLNMQIGEQSFGEYIATDTTLRSVPVFRTLFLDVIMAREMIGSDSMWLYFAPIGVHKLFQFTALGDYPVICYDTYPPNSAANPQVMVLGYGGSPHMAAGDDCSQDIFHTGANIMAGVRIQQAMNLGAMAGPEHLYTRLQMPSLLLANLAWLDSLQISGGGGMTWNTYPQTLRNGTYSSIAGIETGSRTFWSVYNEIHSFFPDSTLVKVDYNGRLERLGAMLDRAETTVDYIVKNNLSYIWASEYIRAHALRLGLNVPVGYN